MMTTIITITTVAITAAGITVIDRKWIRHPLTGVANLTIRIGPLLGGRFQETGDRFLRVLQVGLRVGLFFSLWIG